MGQYYRPLLIRKGRATRFGSFVKPDKKTADEMSGYTKQQIEADGHFYMAAKLTEHSWVGNYYVEGIVENLIAKGSAQVAWVGDYATLPEKYASKDPWAIENGRDVPYSYCTKKNVLDGLYIINETKKICIDFDKYYAANNEKGVWVDAKGKKHEYEECMHPLPLLTAVGNGSGGGDYNGSNMALVGSWAFDVIRISPTVDTGYKKIVPVFKER